jgi:predicted Zn-dependent peptidase
MRGCAAIIKNMIIARILGGDQASPLMQNLRTKQGIVYSASASLASYNEAGLLVATASFTPENKEAAVQGILDEINKLETYITAEEVEDVIFSIIGAMERTEESTQGKAKSLSNYLRIFGETIPLEERREMLMSITPEELKAKIREIFSQAPTVAAYGKGAEALPSYEEITTQLGQTRQVDEKWSCDRSGATCRKQYTRRAATESARE